MIFCRNSCMRCCSMSRTLKKVHWSTYQSWIVLFMLLLVICLQGRLRTMICLYLSCIHTIWINVTSWCRRLVCIWVFWSFLSGYSPTLHRNITLYMIIWLVRVTNSSVICCLITMVKELTIRKHLRCWNCWWSSLEALFCWLPHFLFQYVLFWLSLLFLHWCFPSSSWSSSRCCPRVDSTCSIRNGWQICMPSDACLLWSHAKSFIRKFGYLLHCLRGNHLRSMICWCICSQCQSSPRSNRGWPNHCVIRISDLTWSVEIC